MTAMTKPVGLFHLRTPIDLLKKMEFDFQRLVTDPLNEYAAFDFFVTATHLPEWLGKFRCSVGDGNRRERAMRDLCAHLANGAKHFTTDRHDAVRATGLSTPAISGLARSGITFSGDVQKKLIVLLAADEAAALGVEVISAVRLADMILTHWKKHDAIRRAAAVSR